MTKDEALKLALEALENVTEDYVPPQRPWVSLTDEEIDDIDKATWDEDHKSWGIHDFARAIEAKLRSKNT
jgi:hypothetical protein